MPTTEADMADLLRVPLGVTLSVTIQQLGFMPDGLGPPVRELLMSDDTRVLLALGCYLDDCRSEGSYEPLVKGVEDIRRGWPR